MDQHPTTIGRFRVVRRLGEGGMGVVYAAQDDALEREVAIKLLRTDNPGRSSALMREARAAARITHPSVCTIYEVGEHEGTPFLVMELLDGETVAARLERGPQGAFDACAILIPTLEALDVLHREGLIHLDIKPANIFITSRGVKLVDFGLARGLVNDPATTQSVSSAGLVAGTPAYMAPEQVRNDPVDARTDIFASGVLLFELVTGERPFRGATFVDVLQAVLLEHPPALSGSAALVAIDRVIQQAMAKDPDSRFASALDMATQLRRITDLPRDLLPARIKRLKRIAVLPFRMLRPDPEIDFLRLGLADALGTSLSDHDDLVVRSVLALPAEVSAMEDVRKAGSELDADFVLTGTLLRSGKRVRVAAQLVDVGTGHATWAQQTDGSLDDLFELQDSMTCTIVSSLPFVKSRARDSAEIPRSEVAYSLYLQANQLARQPQTWLAARSLYRESTLADDRFAPSWAGLGRLERVLGKYQVDGADIAEGYALAEAALQRALELNPELPQAHYHYAQLEADTGKTEDALRRLLRRLHVRQTDPEIYAGLVLVCRFCGLLDASVAADQSVRTLDPTFKTSVGLTRLSQGDYAGVLEDIGNGIELDLRILALYELGRYDEARELARQPTARIWSQDNVEPMRRAMRLFFEGHDEQALAALDLAAGVDPQNPNVWPQFPDGEDACWMGRFYARLGRIDFGLAGLRAGVELGYFCVEQFDRDPWLDSLRAEPAFAASMALARAGHARAVKVFQDEGGPGLLGVDAPHARTLQSASPT